MIIGKVKYTVEYTDYATLETSIISTTIDFDDRDSVIYFTYIFYTLGNQFICSVSQAIPKQIIGQSDKLSFAIDYAAYSINHYRLNRKAIFKVLETVQV